VVVIQNSAVLYHRYLNKYREYRRFDSSIEQVSIYCDILWCHDTAKYRDMTIPVLIPCNHFVVGSQENRTSHQNHSCRLKLVICFHMR